MRYHERLVVSDRREPDDAHVSLHVAGCVADERLTARQSDEHAGTECRSSENARIMWMSVLSPRAAWRPRAVVLATAIHALVGTRCYASRWRNEKGGGFEYTQSDSAADIAGAASVPVPGRPPGAAPQSARRSGTGSGVRGATPAAISIRSGLELRITRTSRLSVNARSGLPPCLQHLLQRAIAPTPRPCTFQKAQRPKKNGVCLITGLPHRNSWTAKPVIAIIATRPFLISARRSSRCLNAPSWQ